MPKFMCEGQDEPGEQAFQLRCARWFKHTTDNSGVIDEMGSKEVFTLWSSLKGWQMKAILQPVIPLGPAHVFDQGASIILGGANVKNHNMGGNHLSQSSTVPIFMSIITILSFTLKETVVSHISLCNCSL